jgi:hypothetical protein
MTKQNPFYSGAQNMAPGATPPLCGEVRTAEGDKVALLEAEIKHLRDGLSILADPDSFKGDDGAITVRTSNFAEQILVRSPMRLLKRERE